jgi:hypothetical protein
MYEESISQMNALLAGFATVQYKSAPANKKKDFQTSGPPKK